jgi:Tol biopolymer transport system component
LYKIRRPVGGDPYADPSWSPDSRKIVLTEFERDFQLLVTVGADGQGRRNNVIPTDAQLKAPTWSPDGRYIAFVVAFSTWSDRGDAIQVVNSSGGARREVVRNGVSSPPTWLPDSRRIAFGCEGRICLADAIAGTGGHLFRGLKYREHFSFWVFSPNGRRLAVVISAVSGAQTAAVVGSDGPKMKILAKEENPEAHWSEAHSRLGFSPPSMRPSWSPDGKRVALTIVRAGQSHVYIVNADGSGLRRLTRGPGSDFAPAWRPGQLGWLRETAGE